MNRMQKIRIALEQNPGCQVMYEFPTYEAMQLAKVNIKEYRLEHVINVRVKITPMNSKVRSDLFKRKTSGAAWSVVHDKAIVPALCYKNSNPKGWNHVRFDGFDVNSKGTTVIAAEIRMGTWNQDTLHILRSRKTALEQNPGYRGVYEFPTHEAMEEAKAFVKENRFDHVINVRVRQL